MPFDFYVAVAARGVGINSPTMNKARVEQNAFLPKALVKRTAMWSLLENLNEASHGWHA